jgi:hypothetical protein
MPDLIQLIYSSRPFGYDDTTLSGILLDARRCNTRDGLTGALVCRHDIYLQFLEGPKDQVEAAYNRILLDDRHLEVTKRVFERSSERLFKDWAMLHDPAASWIWSPTDISRDVLDHASVADFKGVFETLAAAAR